MKRLVVITFSAAVLLVAARVGAITDTELRNAYEKMTKPAIMTTAAYNISNLEIASRDFTLKLDTGQLCLLEPITLDSSPRYYGAYFIGRAQFQFAPPVKMEQDQLRRFFKSDSLNRTTGQVLLLFDAQTLQKITQTGAPVTVARLDKFVNGLEDLSQFLSIREEKSFVFQALKNVAFPRKQPYLLVAARLEEKGPIFYKYDPYEREEVSLYRHYREFIVSYFMEPVCSYSIYTDSTYAMINGLNKEPIRPLSYVISARIETDGDFKATARMNYETEISPTQLFTLMLHERLRVDSVQDAAGRKISFLRYESKWHRSEPLYVILPEPHANGDTSTLTFFYHGDMIRRELGAFVHEASFLWYPNSLTMNKASFDITFETNRDFPPVVSAEPVDSRVADGMLTTHWKTIAYDVTFNLGSYKVFRFSAAGVPVSVYYDVNLHRVIHQGQEIHRDSFTDTEIEDLRAGANMPDEVGNDVASSVQLFSEYFGSFPYSALSVAEIASETSSAFPGFVNLDGESFQRTDLWGNEHRHRAHEVAHQWWGVDLAPETYHDQWLSEGFANYCGLLYVQVADGRDRFLYWLREWRKELVALNDYVFYERQEAGPIALGTRTASTKTKADFEPIVYRKSAFVLHMLRNLFMDLDSMKDDRFLSMMQEYYRAYKGRVVTTRDFKAVVDKYAGEDMSWFFDEWVYGSDIPTYVFSYKVSSAEPKGYELNMHIEQRDVPKTFKMYVPVEIEYDSGARQVIRLMIDRPLIDQKVIVPSNPKKVRFNPYESVLADVKQ